MLDFTTFLCFYLFITSSLAAPHIPDYTPTTTCNAEDESCEFWLIIEEKLTMIGILDDGNPTLVKPKGGKLYSYNDNSTVFDGPVIQADGYWENPRLVILANGSLPGPSIEVFYGQKVTVHVINRLKSEGVTIHWHGLHQKGSSFMDGVSFVSQCPILPGQTFSYRFAVEQLGTYWYHAHIGAQRTQGLLGPLIIRPKTNSQPIREHIMTLNDWNHDYDSNTGHLKMEYGLYEGSLKYRGHPSVDGSLFSVFDFQSGLINGLGRYWYDSSTHNEAPLTVFNISPGETVRFRVISAGSLYPLRVTVDGHLLTMISSDGYDFDPVVVESFIMHPGERYDFTITANQSVGNYWIRAQTPEDGVVHIAEAVLQYDGAPLTSDYDQEVEDHETTKFKCTAENPCTVLNCPWQAFAVDSNASCIQLHELTGPEDIISMDSGNEIEADKFYNFGFPGDSYTPGAVNGMHWDYPSVSAYSQKEELDNLTNSCAKQDCGPDKVCICTHYNVLEYGKTYQMTFTNLGGARFWGHPVHMHGHSFQVLKQGFSPVDEDGKNTEQSEDLTCLGTKNYCNLVQWANSSWGGDNVPGLAQRPVLKDTVMVPSGGYTVIRLKADNPGMWFMHCHIELHSVDGMAMMFDEAPDRQVDSPNHFPVCRNYITASGIVVSGGYVEDKQECSRSSAHQLSLLLAVLLLLVSIISD